MVKKLKHKETKNVNIYFVGDMHIGSKTFATKSFLKLIDIIKNDKNAKVILMGDHGDFIEKNDTRRYDPNNISKKYSDSTKQYNAIVEFLKPIKHKIIGVLRGNHEATHAKYNGDQVLNGRDLSEQLANEFKTNYLDDMAIIELTVKRKKYNIVVAHSAGSATSLTAQINNLFSIINGFDCTPEVMCMGHTHALQTILNPKLNFNFNTNVKHVALTGSFYKTYMKDNINYASSNMYSPLPIGCVMYSFNGKGDIVDNKIIL